MSHEPVLLINILGWARKVLEWMISIAHNGGNFFGKKKMKNLSFCLSKEKCIVQELAHTWDVFIKLPMTWLIAAK